VSQNGKGSKRRPQQVDEGQLERNWRLVFGKVRFFDQLKRQLDGSPRRVEPQEKPD
jgi:hypothetical protein